ncbi:MAG: AraC family transcriptional regulator, partial [Holdemania filiformis]
ACGFSDSKYFYRNFQQEFKMTPSQWKSRWTQGRCPDEERMPLRKVCAASRFSSGSWIM